ncbi:enoyl-CoA hydratase/isomerase family protein [Microvirga flavescens]|uniref:enoyl-CoA hydratase/isomerase family protein n=1 Tax=Microvirga flavescens TaxID=2249811 RepID=UPI000DD8DB6B|nr:enoyl-CoA hydratase/isomerase family protein [Microvirga flavescens]
MSSIGEVICERQGSAGIVTLNRPAALNALTLGMVREMRKALDAWAGDPAVTRIVVTGAGEKAFCAGGDVRRLHDLGKAGEKAEALVFWREEYQLNTLIKRYPKPYISLIDGICMGGGVGLSLHGTYRVAGSRYLFAMPEVGIGFFPDVGGTYALPRLSHRAGMYLALTGERLRLADGVLLGLVTHAAASEAMPEIKEALSAGGPVGDILARYSIDPGAAPLQPHLPLIEECFSGDSVGEILDRLDRAAATGSEFVERTAATMRTKSPTSLRLAFEQVRRGGSLTFEEAMQLEFRMVSRIIDDHDFYEGVRAALVDKDGKPVWKPATLDAVEAEMIERHFAPLPPGDELKVI